MVCIIVIETNLETGNSVKIFFIKKTIDQIRFLIKWVFSLEHFKSIFSHDFRSLSWVRNEKVLIKLGSARNQVKKRWSWEVKSRKPPVAPSAVM